jgi:ribonuclease PH
LGRRKTPSASLEQHELSRFFRRRFRSSLAVEDLTERILLVGEEENLHMADVGDEVANLSGITFGLLLAPGMAEIDRDRPVSPLWRSSRVTCYAAWAA